MLAIFLLCLFGITLAQQPKPCSSPAQWESAIYDSAEQQHASLRGRVSYDSIYHRLRVLERVKTPTEDISLDVLELYDAKLVFMYNLQYSNCSRFTLNEPWLNYGISENDTSYGEAYIGSSAVQGGGILITIWAGNFTVPGSEEVIPYIGTWTYEGCLPVSRTTYSSKSGTEVLSFYDVTVGISDPNVFIPRRECLTDFEWENRYALFGKPPRN